MTKSPCQLFIFVFACLAGSASTYAQSPREQLQQMVEQLQKSPNDSALRERTIKFATTLKPAPVIPEEANRAFVKGNVFQKEAKDIAGYEMAIFAYREALRFAPWWGDVYFNMAVAQELAGKFNETIVSVRAYLASVPTSSAEAREAQNKIYALEAKMEMAAVKKSPNLAGNWKVFVNGNPQGAGGNSSSGGTWTVDFHYRFEMKGNDVVVYFATDSDPILDNFNKSWCRRAGGTWSCTGDEDIFGRFSVEGNVIRGAYLLDNRTGDLVGTFSEPEIRWGYEYRDKYGVHRRNEILRKQN